MKQIISVVLIVALAATSTSWAQGGPKTEGAEPSKRPLTGINFRDAQNASRRLFASRRFSMSHTVGMGLNAGPAGGKYLYYLNTTAYRVTPKFTVFAGVGVQHAFGGRPAFGWPALARQEVVIHYGFLYAPRPGAQIGFQMTHVIRRRDRTPPFLAASKPKLIPLARADDPRARSALARTPGPVFRSASSPPTKPSALQQVLMVILDGLGHTEGERKKSPASQRGLRELQPVRGGASHEVAHPPEARPPEVE